jgi:hypothetical protein
VGQWPCNGSCFLIIEASTCRSSTLPNISRVRLRPCLGVYYLALVCLFILIMRVLFGLLSVSSCRCFYISKFFSFGGQLMGMS